MDLALWLTLTLRGAALLLLLLRSLLLFDEGLSCLFLLHLNELLRGHPGFGSLGLDLLTLEGLELWNGHASLLGLHGDHLLNLLRREGLSARRGTWLRHDGDVAKSATADKSNLVKEKSAAETHR